MQYLRNLRPLARAYFHARARWSRHERRRNMRGLTLIELLVVLTIIGLVSGGVIYGMTGSTGARLRQGSTLLSSAIRTGYTRASATSKSVRLVMDFDEKAVWIEEADRPMLVQTSVSGGAEARTALEQAAQQESDSIVRGPRAPRPSFRPVEALKKKKLPRDVDLRSVQTTHDEEPVTSGRAYLYFWPGGQTERASIQIAIHGAPVDDSTNTVLVAPLTGKTNIKPGASALEKIPEDKGDRDESGFQ